MRIQSTSSNAAERRGVVLLGVVIVIVVLALIGYHYSDHMVAEYQGAINAHRAAQLRCGADSAVHLAAMMLSSPDHIDSYLGGNPFDNAERFRSIVVGDRDNPGQGVKFTVFAPIDPDQSSSGGSMRYGVTCEAGKININAFIKRDPTGEQLYNMLVKLPNMAAELAAAIVDWVDADTEPREGGNEDGAKNAALDSLEELLLISGMTRELLYGSDLLRTGVVGVDGTPFTGPSDRGLSAFLTVSSREPNRDAAGQPLININSSDLTALSEKLAPHVPDDMLKFIILFRQYGPMATTATATVEMSTGTGAVTVQTTQPQAATTTVAGNLASIELDLTVAGSKTLTSFLDLVTAQVSVAGAMGEATVYSSPLMDVMNLGETLPLLYEIASLNDDPEIPARICVNTAPREVLLTVEGLTEVNVEQIVSLRPRWGESDSASGEFQSLAWLAGQAGVSIASLKNLEKVLTTRSQVFHMQILGQFENGVGPTVRVEAIVDANYGRPRIVYYRDWSELGRTKLPE